MRDDYASPWELGPQSGCRVFFASAAVIIGVFLLLSFAQKSSELNRSASPLGRTVVYSNHAVGLAPLVGAAVVAASIYGIVHLWRTRQGIPAAPGSRPWRGVPPRRRRWTVLLIALTCVPLLMGASCVYEVPVEQRVVIQYDDEVVSVSRTYLIRWNRYRLPFEEIREVTIEEDLDGNAIRIVTASGRTTTIELGKTTGRREIEADVVNLRAASGLPGD